MSMHSMCHAAVLYYYYNCTSCSIVIFVITNLQATPFQL